MWQNLKQILHYLILTIPTGFISSRNGFFCYPLLGNRCSCCHAKPVGRPLPNSKKQLFLGGTKQERLRYLPIFWSSNQGADSMQDRKCKSQFAPTKYPSSNPRLTWICAELGRPYIPLLENSQNVVRYFISGYFGARPSSQSQATKPFSFGSFCNDE